MVGVSHDSVESHRAFVRKNAIPFYLISDITGEICRLYDVRRRFGIGTSRVTYIINKVGIIHGVYHHELRVGRHIVDVLKGLESLTVD